MKKMKKLLIVLLALTMILTVGCSTKDNNNAANEGLNNESPTDETTNPIEELDLDYSTGLDDNGFYVDVTATDFVEMVDYENILIPSANHVITEENIQANLDTILSSFTSTIEVTDRALVDGDTVNMDYVGSVDGVEFEGGSTGGAGTEVTIGVTAYIDDFLAQLIGHTPGESFDIQVTFPEDYGVENLNGKEATFAITLNHIIETVTPELTDAFVQENLTGNYNSETVEEFMTFLKKDLKETAIKGYIQNYLIENMTVTSVPEAVLMYQQLIMTNYYEMSAYSYNMTVEEFLASYVGYDTVEALLEAASGQMQATAELAMIVQAIAEDANLTIDDEILTLYFTKYTGNADYSEYEGIYGLSYLKNSILQETVLDYLVGKAELE